jgi:cytochrome P450
MVKIIKTSSMIAQPSAQLDPPLRPQAPRPAHFDRVSGVWVLSRYSDVLAAFRELSLWPVGTRGQDQSIDRDETGKLTFRGDLQRSLPPSSIVSWQSRVEALSRATLDQLPTGRPIELLGEFAEPVCLTLAMGVTGVDQGDRQRLHDLSAQVFSRTDSPDGAFLRAHASAELARIFEKSPIPRSEQTFIGIAKTLPRLLTSGWVALLRHPEELMRLRREPDLMPRAVEELMRYAPTVHMVSRRAMADVDLDGLPISQSTQVNLMLASANRDPEQFPDPNRLDVSRRAANQAALGIGRDSCAGAAVVRMVFAATTAAFLESFHEITATGPVQWQSGPESCWPESVYVGFKRETAD